MLDLCDLAKSWDEVESIRSRLRDGKNLVDAKPGNVDSSIIECIKNEDCLIPMLHRFFAGKMKLPDIGGLRFEIENVYKKASRDPEESLVDDNAWDLRKMLRFIKRKAGRDDPSTDPLTHSWVPSILINTSLESELSLSPSILINQAKHQG